jgi:predicted metal-dependent phosphoesterase TrpH
LEKGSFTVLPMRIDLHCHTKYSHDNYFEPQELIEQAIQMNLDGVCIAEHFSMIPPWAIEILDIPPGFYFFTGVEISTNRGHLLAYGIKDDSWNTWFGDQHNLDAVQVTENVHKRGGICVPAHPFRGWDSFGEEVWQMDGFDAIETHNGLNDEDKNRKALQVAMHRNLPSVGGSDCHSREQVGRAFTEFKNPVRTIEELIEEIRRGNCRGTTL